MACGPYTLYIGSLSVSGKIAAGDSVGPESTGMYRSSDVVRPKTKIRVEMHRDDGSVMEGHVFVAGHERVLDLLNNKEPFLPFETEDGRYVMINKAVISLIWPQDKQWMGSSYKAAPLDPAPITQKAGGRG